MTRALALAALLLASCGDAQPTRIDRIREQAEEQRRREIFPLPAIRPAEDLRYTGARKPDPFYPG